MSDLRRQLDAARDQHRSHRYPGDLAAQLLTQPATVTPAGEAQRSSNGLRLIAAGSLITGLAAAVMLWIGTRPQANDSARPGSPLVVVTTTQQLPKDGMAVAAASDESAPLPSELSTIPSFPDDVPL